MKSSPATYSAPSTSRRCRFDGQTAVAAPFPWRKAIGKKLVPALAGFTLLLSACGRQRAAPAAEADLFAGVREHMMQLVVDGEVPSLAVAVAQGGRIVWEEAVGLADRERNIPATAHTPYPLASITKPMTATALMLLVERGLIDLDTPVNDVLGMAAVQARVGEAAEATVRRVAGHTAGLPLHARHFYDGEDSRPPPSEETFHRYAKLVTAPGERFQYSNLGYGLLGRAIARVSGRSYADFMREELFAPLGMQNTVVHSGPGLEAGLAVKYTPSMTPVPPCESDCPAASAIYASAHDLIRFAMFHLKNRLPDQRTILSGTAIDAMQRPSPETGPLKTWEQAGSGYGIGWYIGVTPDGLRVVRHNGGTQGVSTELALLPEENLAVAVLANTQSMWPEAILMEILGTLLPDRLAAFPAPAGGTGGTDGSAGAPRFAPGRELTGSWEGAAETTAGEVRLSLAVEASGKVYARLGEQSRVLLQNVSYRSDFSAFNAAGGGPYLRGLLPAGMNTEDVNRGRPCTFWLELKLRDQSLTGSLIAFSQRKNPTGPLSHYVELRRK